MKCRRRLQDIDLRHRVIGPLHALPAQDDCAVAILIAAVPAAALRRRPCFETSPHVVFPPATCRKSQSGSLLRLKSHAASGANHSGVAVPLSWTISSPLIVCDA